MPTAPCDRDKGEEGGRAEGCWAEKQEGATKEIPKRSFNIENWHPLIDEEEEASWGEYHQSIEVQ